MKINSVKLFTISAAIFVVNLLFSFILFRPILHHVVKSQKALRAGNEVRDFYLKLPVPLKFRVYFFNISNPTEVIENGKTPVLKEIGPYCYDAFKEKIVVEEDNKNDTLTYTPYETYFFNKKCSGPFKQDDYVTILHPLIVGIIGAVQNVQPNFLKVVNKGLKSLFKENNSIYLTTKVKNILFDGILIDCNTKDFSAAAICSQLRTKLDEVDNGILNFSLLGKKNGTIPKRLTVQRGIKNGRDVGRLIAVGNNTDLNTWGGKNCDKFRGTDGWIFPPFLKKKDGIWSVSLDLCRNIKAVYVGNQKYHGVSVRKYHATLGDMSRNPEEACFCSESENCLPKGVMDLSKCLDAPIHATLPHFLDVDPRLAESVEGLQPELEKHVIEIIFEPMTGTPMAAYKRIQFNLIIQPLEKISIMQNVPEALHPILWIEESIELEGFLLKKITSVFLLLKIFSVFKFIVLFSSLGVAAFAGYKIYVGEADLRTVHPVLSTTEKIIEQKEFK